MLRRALGVENRSQLAPVGGVVAHAQRRVELALAHGYERPALGHRPPVEAVEGEEIHQIGHATSLEHNLVVTGRHLDRSLAAAGTGGGVAAQGLSIQIGEAGGIGRGDTVGTAPAAGARHTEDGIEGGARVVAVEALTGRVGKVPVVEARLTEPRAHQALAGGDESGHRIGSLGWADARRARVVMHVLSAHQPGRRGQAGPARVDGPEGGRGQGAVHHAGQGLVVTAVGGSRRRATVDRELQVDLGVLVHDVLVDERIGEAGEALAGMAHGHRRCRLDPRPFRPICPPGAQGRWCSSSHPDANVSEPAGHRGMARMAYLQRLALAAVGRAPELPLGLAPDPVQ